MLQGYPYIIDPATRLKGVEKLIDRDQYFVIHAARQSGETVLQRVSNGGGMIIREMALYF